MCLITPWKKTKPSSWRGVIPGCPILSQTHDREPRRKPWPHPPQVPCGVCQPAATLISQAKISRAEKQSPCWQMDGIASRRWGRQFSRKPTGCVAGCWRAAMLGQAKEMEMCLAGLSVKRSDDHVADQVRRSVFLSCPQTLHHTVYTIYRSLGQAGLSIWQQQDSIANMFWQTYYFKGG